MRKLNYLNSLYIIMCILLLSCQEKKNFTIISDLELGESIDHHPTVKSLQKAVQPLGVSLTFHNEAIEKEADIISLINDKKIDIGIVKNDVDIQGGFTNVRTLLPLFPDVMLILSRDDSSKTVQELFAHSKTAMILDKAEEKNVITQFLKKNGTPADNIDVIHAYDSAGILNALNENDVLMLFASLNSQSVRNILRSWNGTIYSLDDPALIGKGSMVDGFCMAYPKAVPFIIPKGTYGRWPLKPVLTFAVYDVIICHQDLDDHVAYDVLKTIYDMRPSLAEENFEFGLLEADVESHKFSFPLHKGAMNYMARNEPTYWERESDLLGLIFSVVVLTSGGLTTLFKHLKQRRKDRVDTYYQKVLFVSNSARANIDVDKKQAYLQELFQIRANAFDQLVRENLDANEAFTIFVNLLNATIHELEQDIRQTQLKETV